MTIPYTVFRSGSVVLSFLLMPEHMSGKPDAHLCLRLTSVKLSFSAAHPAVEKESFTTLRVMKLLFACAI